MRWLPRWVAEAISVPLAAQVACTPVVTAISGQISLVAVLANLLAAPAVGAGDGARSGGRAGRTGLGAARPGGGRAGGLVGVVDRRRRPARRGAADRRGGVGDRAGRPGRAHASLCVVVVVAAPRLLRSPVAGVGCSVLLVVTVLTRPPSPGWPPDGWVLAMCDVGQGDGLVLRAGPGTGVVVDAGPDPALIDRCLARLGVTERPAGRADALPRRPRRRAGRACSTDREVGEVDVTSMVDPPEGVDGGGVGTARTRPPVVAAYGVTRAGRRRDPADAVAAARRADRRGRVTAARPTTRAWCCWRRCAASGSC